MLEGKRIILGVTGGIAVYKLVDVASKLTQAGAAVDVIMTEAAQRFVTPLTFAAITHRKVRTDLFADWLGDDLGHVSMAREADALVIAPATANTLARLAAGMADDLVCAVTLSTTAPLLLVPAMESHMYQHAATQANLALLRERGARIMEPGSGHLASGATGVGRLPEPAQILDAIKATLGQGGPLHGRRIVITAGGTHEPLDPVRYIGNRSSGRMGWALVDAALLRGAMVTLIHGPVNSPAPWGVEAIPVQTTAELNTAVREAVVGADVLIMAAAPADFRPAHTSSEKIKKVPGEDTLTLTLVKNPDILAGLRGLPGTERLIKVGFAAETHNLLDNARAKMVAKDQHLQILNEAVSSLGSETSAVTILDRDGGVETLPTQPKAVTAGRILDRIAALLAAPTT
jgi:phosphopantothenoylcysteine decarboxylase/phosphopantothenate--cysteine ligase